MQILPDQSPSDGSDTSADRTATKISARSAAETSGLAKAAFALTPSESTFTSRSALVQIIESEIIPRLFLAHREHSSPHALPPSSNFRAAPLRVSPLIEMFMHGENEDIVHHMQTLINDGMQREKIYFELLASVPRTLSLMWEQGLCSMDDMTAGLRCLDQVLLQMHRRDEVPPESL